MIQTNQLTKRFDTLSALDQVHIDIPTGSIYGLVGSNGSGKSTLLRLISGVYRPDDGAITVDGQDPYENIPLKDEIAFVCDEPYFFSHSTMNEMASFYKGLYSGFDHELYQFLCDHFPIDPRKRIHNFSKGMKRQVTLILGLARHPRYLLLDEAFDGLDPVVRGALRKILADQMAEHGMTVVIASHNLRELEDLCDHVGLLHQGHIIFEREIDENRLGFCKVQAAFQTPPAEDAFTPLHVMQKKVSGSIVTLVVKGGSSDVLDYIETLSPLLAESVPLTLEEVFVHEMEAVGYDYNKIIF